MKVTGQRATAATGTAKHPAKTEGQAKKQKKGFSEEDGFEAPVKKASATKKTAKKPPVEATPSLLEAGAKALERDRKSVDEQALRDAGWLLGGITASMVINVLHEFQVKSTPQLDASVKRLGELCGALLIEFLGGLEEDLIDEAQAVSAAPDSFGSQFEASFGMSPLEATFRFVDFIRRTEGQPDERLRGSLYWH